MVNTLTRGGRDRDLAPLHMLARGKLACQALALEGLRARFKCGWEQSNSCWDEAIRELKEKWRQPAASIRQA